MLRVKLLLVCLAASLCLPELYPASSLFIRPRPAPQLTGPLRRITDTPETSLNLNPSLSGDGRRVVFESTADLAATGGPGGFHALRADIMGAPPAFIEMGKTRSPAPAVSQDGSLVAFASTGDPLGRNGDGNSEIFLYDGAALRQLTNTQPRDSSSRTTDGNFQPSMTDDGRLIAFSSNRDLTGSNTDASREIFLLDTTTQSFAQLTDTAAPGFAAEPKLSGDGSHVAYLRNNGAAADGPSDLLLYDRTRGTTRLVESDARSVTLTGVRAMSDDGTRIVYSALTGAERAAQVFLFDERRGAIRQVTSLGARADDVPLNPTISGDGTRLSFASRASVRGAKSDHGVELYLFDIPTGQFRQITDAPSSATAEVVSSLNDDGSLVAFNFPRVLSGPVQSGEFANNSEIYVAALDARPPYASGLRITNAASLGREPASPAAVAPASIAIAYGSALAFDSEQAVRGPDGNFPYSLGGTTVRVGGRAARLFYVSPSQVNFLIPPETAPGPTEFAVANAEGFETRGTMEITRTAPGIFTLNGEGSGAGLLLDAETLQPGPFDPTGGARRIVLFATGLRFASQIDVRIDGRPVKVESVLASTDLPGLDEMHLLLPASLGGAGDAGLSLRADGRESNPVMLTLAGGHARDIVINEILADPPDGIDGDANHDGARSSSQDEFIELVNATGRDMDIGGYQLTTRASAFAEDTIRHIFAPGTVLYAGTAVVVFGGANSNGFNPHDSSFGGAQVLTASTGGLSLVNSGGIVSLKDGDGLILDQLSYGGASALKGDANQSLTRSPDVSGRFSLHGTAAGGAGRLYSPGTRVDGTPFIDSKSIARVEVSPASASVTVGARQQFNARAFDAEGRELSGVLFAWRSSAPSVAAIDGNGTAGALSEGTAEIRAFARGLESAPAQLSVRTPERILTRILVEPSSFTSYPGATRQFVARAFDQDEREMTGLAFDWSTADSSVATVDRSGLATALKAGSTTVRATAGGLSGEAILNVSLPPLVINELLADPPDGIDGDANHDGVRSGADDEFIELFNSSTGALDLSGWTIRTRPLGGGNETSRHTFAKGTSLAAGDGLVVFGGGAFDAQAPFFGGAQVFKASGGGLSLSNNGLEIIIRDAASNLVTRLAYGTPQDNFGGDSVNQSITRSPDVTGEFVRHSAASGAAGRLYSPGTKSDGAFFAPRMGQLAKVTLSSVTDAIFAGQSTELVAQALDQFDRPLSAASLSFSSSDSSIASVEKVFTDAGAGRATATVYGRAAGAVSLSATAIYGTGSIVSRAATLTVRPAPPLISRVELTPASSVVNRGGTSQFRAVALDRNDQPVPQASFRWSSSDTSVAAIGPDGTATGAGIGTAIIKASVADGAGGEVSATATLGVRMPLVINELLADVPPDDDGTPAIVEGDANRDGVRSSDDDEFIELFNYSSAPLDLSGLRIFDSGSANPRFTFPQGTVLAGERALVIFGGGSPQADGAAFGGALILTVANSASPSSTLSLNDGGDSVSLRLPVGNNDVTVASLTYGTGAAVPAPLDQSLARSPDAGLEYTAGQFIPHSTAPNAAGRLYSPGTRADGTPFGSPAITRIEIRPADATIDSGATTGFNAHAFTDAAGAETEIGRVSFIWDAADKTKAGIAPDTGPGIIASAVSYGTTTIRARAGGREAVATLTIKPPPPVLTSITLTPRSAVLTEGENGRFMAQALDQYGQPMTDISLAFSSSDTSVATVDAVTVDASSGSASALVNARKTGTAQITASATDGQRLLTSQPSILTVKPAPPVVRRIEVGPTSATVGVGATQQFTALAFDQHEQPITGVVFKWSSSDTSVAVVNTDGLATGIAAGAARIVASAGDVNSEPVSLLVTAPPVPAPGEVIINEALVSFASSTTQARHDFLELYNTAGRTLDISGLLISFRPGGSGNSPATVMLPGSPGSGTTLISPRGYFLIVNGVDTFGVAADYNAPGLDFNNTTGGIRLEIDGLKLDGLAYQGGTAAPAAPFSSYGEGSLFVFTGGTTNDLIRSPNAVDTGNNASDYRRNGTAASVSPRTINPTIP